MHFDAHARRIILTCVMFAGATTFDRAATAAEPKPANPGQAADAPRRSAQELQQALEYFRGADVGYRFNFRAVVHPDYKHQFSKELPSKIEAEMALYDEVERADKRANVKLRFPRLLCTSMGAFLDHEPSVAKVAAWTASANPAEQELAKLAGLLRQWWEASDDPEAQAKALDAVDGLLAEYPSNNELAQTLATMQRTVASIELGERVGGLITERCKGSFAKQVKAKPYQLYKPLALSGTTATGKNFNIAALKGKVVVIDFWATWCAPCVADMPKMIALYKEFRDQGVEFVGIKVTR